MGLLVLSRQRDESIMIGDGIIVTVEDIRGDSVRISVNAPPEIAVDRAEVRRAKLANPRFNVPGKFRGNPTNGHRV